MIDKAEIANALAILNQAMQLEKDGREFYLKAARGTSDEKGQAIFRTLASDERNHLNLIQKQQRALTRQSKWVSSPQVKPTPIVLNNSLFPKGREALEKAVGQKSADRDALLFGLDIETKSYDLYRKAALETANEIGKSMFEFLAGEEKRHFDILMMRYDFLFGPVAWTS